MKLNFRKAHITLESTMATTTIIVAVLLAINPAGMFSKALVNTLTSVTSGLVSGSDRIQHVINGSRLNPAIAADISSYVAMLKGTPTGAALGNFIESQGIGMAFFDASGAGASNLSGYWSKGDNTIYISQDNQSGPQEVITAIIAHEATHARYDEDPDAAIAETLARHPELTIADLSVITDGAGNVVGLQNSIDQEYVAFFNNAQVWNEIKGSLQDASLDYDAALILQGEAAVKADIRLREGYIGIPEY